ncbi:hypothetical protein GBA52_018496 [Prunus armeniaca]|nr:hypothetical protein GBA52_018496 [Prunus armeniaca]
MENSEDGSNSKGMCEKIFSSLCPNFQTNHHGHRHHKLEPTPTSVAPNTSLPVPTHDHTGYSNSVQIKLTNVSGAEPAPTGIPRMPKAEMSMANNDAFSEYINRTKFKIKAMSSNVGIEKVASRAGDVYETKQDDNEKDMFTDFVNRAKFKIRKTSSIGSRRNISFKK